jgi:AraC-like DNA-binding protein
MGTARAARASWSAREDQNRRLLRARDAMDRDYAERLDLPALARLAHMSEGHFSRTFRATFGETPHRYLQRRRIERAMALLRAPASSVTDVGLRVGFDSLGAFSRAFLAIVGVSPSQYRDRGLVTNAPDCFVRSWLRPVSFGEAPGPAAP